MLTYVNLLDFVLKYKKLFQIGAHKNASDLSQLLKQWLGSGNASEQKPAFFISVNMRANKTLKQALKNHTVFRSVSSTIITSFRTNA